MVTLELLLPSAIRTTILAAVGMVGLAAIVAADWRTANRLRREREADQ